MKAKDFGYIGLVVIALVCALIVWLMFAAPSDEPTRIQINGAFLCQLEGNKWEKTESFIIGQDVYICGQVSANSSEFRKQIQIRIYEGERATLEKPIYYEDIWLTDESTVIPVNADLASGNYSIEISDGRIILSALQVIVVNK